jgi:O-antigen/teichoic acid export membrane protein
LENKARRYATIMVINIMINIVFNLFFLVVCPSVMKGNNTFLQGLINPIYSINIGVGYVFISNLISSLVTLILLFPELFKMKFSFDKVLWKRMLIYSLPLLIGGFAGMINETMDRILLKYLVTDKASALEQLGIYGACYKVSIMMTLFVQTFRQAAEPFFFTEAKSEDSKKIYADVMKYFIIACSLIFLGIMMNMDIVKYFVGMKFRSGLKVVPILLLANLCLGVFFNLSIWYKLTGHTRFGAYLAIFGALITLILNFWWIPIIGYMGAAWATLICYGSMMAASYFIGQKYYPVDYHLTRIFSYLALAIGLYFISAYLQDYISFNRIGLFIFNNFLLASFILFAWLMEKPKAALKI